MSIPSFERSFASHKKHIFWSKKNEKQPREVFKSSGKKCLFDCEKCGHEFESALNHITNGNSWCPFCANKQLCNNEECETCLKKSFASHPRNKNWSSKNDKTPRELFKGANSKKHSFVCEKCSHEFESNLSNICKGQWCGFCANKQLCSKEDCETCFNKSFASHPRAIHWSSKNGNINPRELFKSSNSKYSFVCENGHEFKIQLNDVSNGRWCPKCKHKTETKLYERMIPLFPSIITQYKQDWCKKTNHLPFDFCIPEDNIIIELDGRQHFIQVSNWESPEENFENDKYKEKCANENGYSTIRILQEDVLYDKYDWCKELCETIENIRNGDKIVNIYLCKNNEYDLFM
jgi:very-short-patch-repair endonuclease